MPVHTAPPVLPALNALPEGDARALTELFARITDLFAARHRGCKPITAYDALAARHDLLLIENQSLLRRIEDLESRLSALGSGSTPLPG